MSFKQACTALEAGKTLMYEGRRFKMYGSEIWIGAEQIITLDRFVTQYNEASFTLADESIFKDGL